MSEINEPYLKRILQYFNYWVNDVSKAEELTLRTLRRVRDVISCDGDYEKTHVRVFKNARKELQGHLKSGNLKPVLPALSTMEHEVLSLRLGASLPAPCIARILGRSRSDIMEIVCHSVYKLKVNKEDS